MRLATTIGDFKGYASSDAERVRMYEGTGFKHLDYDFYKVIYPGSPFLGDHWMDAIKDAAREAERLGFDFVQAHAPDYNPLDPSHDDEMGMLATYRTIEACNYLGIQNLVIHPAYGKPLRYPDDLQAFFDANEKFYRPLVPYIEKYNVNLLMENGAEKIMQGYIDFMTAQEMMDFIHFFGHPQMHACWDTGHANLRDTDPIEDLNTFGSELYALHVQDNFGDYDEHIAPFMGTFPLDSLMQGLKKINYQGYFTFEANNMLMFGNSWPHMRKEYPLPEPARVRDPSPAVKKKAIELLYEIGKYVLTAYDCFED